MELDEDVESDLHRFHGVWVDIDRDEFGELGAERFFSLVERLSAYDGVVAARMYNLREEAKKQNPSAATIAKQPGTVVHDNLAAGILADPATARDVEYEQV